VPLFTSGGLGLGLGLKNLVLFKSLVVIPLLSVTHGQFDARPMVIFPADADQWYFSSKKSF